MANERLKDMTKDVDGSAASDCYAAYRLAGELFGRLETSLGFGKLTLHKDARVFVFSWGFTAKGKSYGNQWSLDSREMLMDQHMLDRAESIARKWKAEHRKVSA
jgi:hypothetical protein